MFLDRLIDSLDSFSGLLGAFAGAGNGKRIVILNCDDEKLILPVTPAGYEVTSGQNNKVVNITEFGEALIFGNRKLESLKLKCFLPHLKHEYPFLVGDARPPTEIVELLKKWKEKKSPIRVIITDSSVNMMMALNSFEYSERDGTRDVYYSLSFIEHKELNTPMANNDKQINKTTELKERANPTNKERLLTLKSNLDDGLDKMKRVQGTYNNWRKVAKSNSLQELNVNIRRAMKKG